MTFRESSSSFFDGMNNTGEVIVREHPGIDQANNENDVGVCSALCKPKQYHSEELNTIQNAFKLFEEKNDSGRSSGQVFHFSLTADAFYQLLLLSNLFANPDCVEHIFDYRP
ncbi:MAG: hypothetical protein ACOYXT_19570 [Bacteroidota bacterium]